MWEYYPNIGSALQEVKRRLALIALTKSQGVNQFSCLRLASGTAPVGSLWVPLANNLN